MDPHKIYKTFMVGLIDSSRIENNNRDELLKHHFEIRKKHENPISTISENIELLRFDLFNTKVASSEEAATETLDALWPLLKYGRVIGVIPLIRRGNNLIVPKLFHFVWFWLVLVMILQLIMLCNTAYQSLESDQAVAYVKKINYILYYAHTVANAAYMIGRIRRLPQLFALAKKIEVICMKHQNGSETQVDKKDNLIRSAFILLLVLTGAQLFGMALFFSAVGMDDAKQDYATSLPTISFFILILVDRENPKTIPEYFSTDAFMMDYWDSWISGVVFAVGELYADMGWAFGDVFLAIFSFVFARYFTRLNSFIKEASSSLTIEKIEELRADHKSLSNLVEEMNDIYAPLVLLTFLANLAYLFTRLYFGLSKDLKDASVLVRLESIYAFLYQVSIKILVPSYFASRLNEEAHDGLKMIHGWPSGLQFRDSKDRLLLMNRFVSQLATNKIGISGCGFFIIDKNFMVTMISAIVTYEVVILQFQGASLKSE